VQALSADPEWMIDALVPSSDMAVERNRDPEAQPGHQRAVEIRFKQSADPSLGWLGEIIDSSNR
jgi:hypothetical protein